MHDVERDFFLGRGAESRRVPLCCVYADEDVAMLKADHISRALLVQKLPVQGRHAGIGNQDHIHRGEFPQLALRFSRSI